MLPGTPTGLRCLYSVWHLKLSGGEGHPELLEELGREVKPSSIGWVDEACLEMVRHLGKNEQNSMGWETCKMSAQTPGCFAILVSFIGFGRMRQEGPPSGPYSYVYEIICFGVGHLC